VVRRYSNCTELLKRKGENKNNCLDIGFCICYSVFSNRVSLEKMKKNKKMDAIDVNARALIAFSLTMILAILAYVFFFRG